MLHSLTYAAAYATTYVTARFPMAPGDNPTAPAEVGKDVSLNMDGIWSLILTGFAFIVVAFGLGLGIGARKNKFKDTMESSGNMGVSAFWVAVAMVIASVVYLIRNGFLSVVS